jgi:tRNA-dihydrouridine synthase A
MMDWTDRHCRAFHRTLTRHALLYTEMVTTKAVIHGDRERLLGYSEVEHPVALQLGGSEPDELAQCAKIAEDWGYDEVNLNCGCPSDRVQSGAFGACLMREPDLVAEGMRAMIEATKLPVTVKCRIGVDDQEPRESLFKMVESCRKAGVTSFAVHARKAWLKGLSPKENRDVPPGMKQRLAKKKRESLTTTGVFLIFSAKSMALATVASEVFSPRMISTSIILSTGEKKWMPI